MDKVNMYRITGEYKRNGVHKFSVTRRGMTKENVQDRVLHELGSKHGVKRRDVTIQEIKTIQVEETKNPLLIQLSK